MKTANALTLLSTIIFSCGLASAQPPPPAPAGEAGWKAGPPPQVEKGERRRPASKDAEAPRERDSMDRPGWKEMGPPPGMEGPPPPGDEFPGRRAFRRLLEVRREAQRLETQAADIEKARERFHDTAKTENYPAERTARVERILDLRKELLALEREEFAARIKGETAKVLTRIEERRKEDGEKPDTQQPDPLAKMEDNMRKINEAAVDFDSLSKALKEMAPELPQYQDGAGRDERVRREMDALRERIDRLRQEFGEPDERGLEDPMSGANPPDRPNRGPRGINQPERGKRMAPPEAPPENEMK